MLVALGRKAPDGATGYAAAVGAVAAFRVSATLRVEVAVTYFVG